MSFHLSTSFTWHQAIYLWFFGDIMFWLNRHLFREAIGMEVFTSIAWGQTDWQWRWLGRDLFVLPNAKKTVWASYPPLGKQYQTCRNPGIWSSSYSDDCRIFEKLQTRKTSQNWVHWARKKKTISHLPIYGWWFVISHLHASFVSRHFQHFPALRQPPLDGWNLTRMILCLRQWIHATIPCCRRSAHWWSPSFSDRLSPR